MPDAINLSVRMARSNLPAMRTVQVAQAMVEITPNAAMLSSAPNTLNMCLVIDHSGSMEAQNKIGYAKEAVRLVLDRLSPSDIISVVGFNSRHTTFIPASTINDMQRPRLKRDIDQIQPFGGTRMAPAMREAIRTLQEGVRLAGQAAVPLNRMVLLTDGRTEREDDCRNTARIAAQQRVGITALGLGTDWNERLLDDIADFTGGVADYVDSPARIIDYFQEAVRSLQAVVIDNASLRLRLAPGVSLRAAYRTMPQISQLAAAPNIGADFGESSTYYIGQVERGRGQALMLELLLPPSEAGNFRVASADLIYDMPTSRQRGLIASADVVATFDPPAQLPNSASDPTVMSVVEKIAAHKLQQRAMEDLNAGDTVGAAQKLQGAATRLLSQGEVELANRLAMEAQSLQANNPMSEEARKAINYGIRKTVHLNLQQQRDIPTDQLG